MQKIPVNLAKAGMVLEKSVLRDNGLVLVAQGTEISEALLNRLENMGVEWITVEGAPVEMEGMAPPKTYEQRMQEMDHLFRRYKNDKWMDSMKSFLKSYFRRKAEMENRESGRAAEAGTGSDQHQEQL